MPLEIWLHLSIGIISWLIASRFLKQKLINVIAAVILGQLLYAIIHYPIAVDSARVLQQKLTLERYLILLPLRIVISFVGAFALFTLTKREAERKTNNIPLGKIFTVIVLFVTALAFVSTKREARITADSNKSEFHLDDWETKRQSQKELNRKTAETVGFDIIREDSEGNQYPLDKGCESNFEFKVIYKGKEIMSDGAACVMDVLLHEALSDEDIVLFDHSGPGVGGEKQSLVTFSGGKATILQSDYSILRLTGKTEKNQDSIKLIDFDGCGKRSIGVYKDLKITWHKEKISVQRGVANAKEYASKNDVESILLIPEVNSKLRELMGQKYNDFEQLLCTDWHYRRAIDLNKELVVITGVPQRFGRYPVWDDAFLSINTNTGDIYAAYFENSWEGIADASKLKGTIYAYSNKKALYAEPPKTLTKWLGQYKWLPEKWQYGTD